MKFILGSVNQALNLKHTYISCMIEERDGDFTNYSIGSATKRICHRQEFREQKRRVRRFESLN